MRKSLPVLLVGLALLACRTTTIERPRARPEARVETASATRTWRVIDQGALIGHVVFFHAPDRPGGSLYVVQNAWGQDLGMIDSLGRAWRYQPHQPEALWLTTGTVAEGVRSILDGGEACTLEEVAVADAREAADPGR